MNRFLISLSNSAVSAFLIVLLSWLLSPAEFGELTYARSIVLFFASVMFDWLSFSILRYWSGEHKGRGRRRLNLQALIGWTVIVIPPLAFVIYGLAGAGVGIAMVLAMVVNIVGLGYCDSRSAIARAECHDRDLAMLILPRAAATLVGAAAAVWAGAGPVGVMMALAAAQGAGILYLIVARRPFFLRWRAPEGPEIARFMRFGGATVVAEAISAAGALALATIAVSSHGPAGFGGYALVNELLTRTVSAAGYALELAMLPLALAALAEGGREAGRAVLARSIGIIVAVLAPMLVGFTLVAPQLAQTALSADQRDVFVALAAWVALQCVFTTGRQFILIQPLFLAERTTLAIGCVLIGAGTAVGLGLILIPAHGALGIAWAQTAGAAVTFALQAAIVGLVFPAFPSRRVFVQIALACAAMAGMLWPLRLHLDGALGLVALVATGATVYAVTLWLLDFEGIRTRTGISLRVRLENSFSGRNKVV